MELRAVTEISVVTFKMSRVQLIQESRGYESTIKVQCSHLVCEECNTMAYDEFQVHLPELLLRRGAANESRLPQPSPPSHGAREPGKGFGHLSDFLISNNNAHNNATKFSSRCRGWSDSAAATEPCCLRMRLETNVVPVSSDSEIPLGISGAPLPVLVTPFLRGQVNDLTMSMLMSTVTGLIDLIEDEILPKPLPIELDVERVCLKLTEDRIPANITSPGSVPTQVYVPKMRIVRDMEGVFTILPQAKETSEIQALRSERDRLLAELREARLEITRLKERASSQTQLLEMPASQYHLPKS
ncbi:hypothetical protein SK128_011372 [Halocaridina rubra]|uniref:Uncharacterized protein n=1 Tax=Halocaridina rubra TaxID=373956 RepID=A0AAN8WYM4_HALRR